MPSVPRGPRRTSRRHRTAQHRTSLLRLSAIQRRRQALERKKELAARRLAAVEEAAAAVDADSAASGFSVDDDSSWAGPGGGGGGEVTVVHTEQRDVVGMTLAMLGLTGPSLATQPVEVLEALERVMKVWHTAWRCAPCCDTCACVRACNIAVGLASTLGITHSCHGTRAWRVGVCVVLGVYLNAPAASRIVWHWATRRSSEAWWPSPRQD